MTRISVYALLDNRRINYVSKPVSSGFIIIKGGDIRFGPYEVSFLSYPASVSSTGLTAPSKSWNGRSTGQQGNEPSGIGAVSYEGLILWDAGGTPLALYQETK